MRECCADAEICKVPWKRFKPKGSSQIQGVPLSPHTFQHKTATLMRKCKKGSRIFNLGDTAELFGALLNPIKTTPFTSPLPLRPAKRYHRKKKEHSSRTQLGMSIIFCSMLLHPPTDPKILRHPAPPARV